MAPSVCFYFQVHQPCRLKDLRMRDIGQGSIDYFDDDKNRQIFRKVAEKCYLPANAVMLKLLKEHKDFRIAYSLSGVFLDQCKMYGPDVLASFQALAKTGKVEFLAETYHHSLAAIKSIKEFSAEVSAHVRAIQKLFHQTPRIFRNTELIFNNEIAQIVRLMGFSGIVAEGADHLLRGRNPNVPYAPPSFRVSRLIERIVRENRPHEKRAKDIVILLKNYRLSDDIAFRFSNKSWSGFPLYAETFADWIAGNSGHSVNLFMDYETFGEHQWEDTGIFDFLAALPTAFEARNIPCLTPSQVVAAWRPDACDIYDAHTTISWADTERDLSAWTGNRIQQSAFDAAFALENAVKEANDSTLLEAWRKLLTSDHFYYMSTKYWNDGDVHRYFSPYESPYEAYRRYSHALCDLKARVTANQSFELREKRHGKKKSKGRSRSISKLKAPLS